MRWPTESLGSLCDVISGGTPKRTVEEYWNGEIPWVKISDMLQGEIKYTDESITEKGLRESPARILEPGTLLLSIFATVGRTAVLAVPAATNQAIVGLRIKKDLLDQGYFRHYLDSQAEALKSKSRGVAQDNINTTILKSLKIPLPPLEEQLRIAAILDKAQGIKEKAAQRSRLLSALGRSLFVRRFGLPSENPYELPLHRLIDICNPKQWPTISSKQLQDRGYPVFGANGLIGYFDSFNHSNPTVLVTCRGATCGTINVSPANCYVTGNSMAMDDPDPGLLTTEYLEWVLRIRGMHDVISGSAQPQITRQGLEAVTIPVPSIEAQNDFANERKAVTRMGTSSRLSEVSVSEVAISLASRLFDEGGA